MMDVYFVTRYVQLATRTDFPAGARHARAHRASRATGALDAGVAARAVRGIHVSSHDRPRAATHSAIAARRACRSSGSSSRSSLRRRASPPYSEFDVRFAEVDGSDSRGVRSWYSSNRLAGANRRPVPKKTTIGRGFRRTQRVGSKPQPARVPTDPRVGSKAPTGAVPTDPNGSVPKSPNVLGFGRTQGAGGPKDPNGVPYNSRVSRARSAATPGRPMW
jgi:hypothetical protein